MRSFASCIDFAILASVLGVVQGAPTLETPLSNSKLRFYGLNCFTVNTFTELVRRQEISGELYEVLPENLIQKAKVHSIRTDLTPKINKNAIRKQIRFGPFLVPGSQVGKSWKHTTV